MRNAIIIGIVIIVLVAVGWRYIGFERRQQLGRSLRNLTGGNGVVEIYSGGQVVQRFFGVEKLSTALGTEDGSPRPYRFGYGVRDVDMDGVREESDGGSVYFEIGGFATYVLFDQ